MVETGSGWTLGKKESRTVEFWFGEQRNLDAAKRFLSRAPTIWPS